MAKIVTLGEIMLRLSPQGNDRFIQSESFRIIPGGGEANVAISVANYGHEAYFVSKLPKHEIGQIAVNALRRYGVNTKFVTRGGDRVGLYYAETGASIFRCYHGGCCLVPLEWYYSCHQRQGCRTHKTRL